MRVSALHDHNLNAGTRIILFSTEMQVPALSFDGNRNAGIRMMATAISIYAVNLDCKVFIADLIIYDEE